MFVWLFHRISGALLIVLMSAQLFTGFFQASASGAESVKTVAALHRHPTLNIVLVFCFIFHGLYGVRTILLDLGMTSERLLFWICTLAGSAFFIAFVVCYLRYVSA